MIKIILVGIIVALVYSQPDLRLTVADWLRAASDFLIESVQVKPWNNFNEALNKTWDSNHLFNANSYKNKYYYPTYYVFHLNK